MASLGPIADPGPLIGPAKSWRQHMPLVLSNKDLFQNQNRRESLMPLSPRPIELNRHTVFHEMRNDGCSLPWGVFRSKILQKTIKAKSWM